MCDHTNVLLSDNAFLCSYYIFMASPSPQALTLLIFGGATTLLGLWIFI